MNVKKFVLQLLYYRIWNLICENENCPEPPDELACSLPVVKTHQEKDVVYSHYYGWIRPLAEPSENGTHEVLMGNGETVLISVGSEYTTLDLSVTAEDEVHVFCASYYDYDAEEDTLEECRYARLICDSTGYHITDDYAEEEKLRVLEWFYRCNPEGNGRRKASRDIFSLEEWEFLKLFLGNKDFATRMVEAVSYYVSVCFDTQCGKGEGTTWNYYKRYSVSDEQYMEIFLGVASDLELDASSAQYTFEDVHEEKMWQKLLATAALLKRRTVWGEQLGVADAIVRGYISVCEVCLIASQKDIQNLAVSLMNKGGIDVKAVHEALVELLSLRERDFTPTQKKKIYEYLRKS